MTIFPDLQFQNGSGLDFPWASSEPGVESGSDGAYGPDGVASAMTIYIFWQDLPEAIKQILGYSWRDTSMGSPILRRVLPWQHPYFNQLWAKSITKAVGLVQGGKVYNEFAIGGVNSNKGPYTYFQYAKLVVQFWRPPYYVRSDESVRVGGSQKEWMRYVDKNWEFGFQMLSREGQQFQYDTNQGSDFTNRLFQGSVGQKLMRGKVRRKWYQVPEAAIFQPVSDGTPNGLPHNLLYTQTAATNPVTNYVYPVGSPIAGCVNTPIGGSMFRSSVTTATGSPTISNITSTATLTVGDEILGRSIPAGATVTVIDDATTVTMSANALANAGAGVVVSFDTSSSRMFGAFCGILLYDSVALTPAPLQMPPELMRIPLFAAGEPISQLQYDVTFSFDLFDPPRSQNGTFRGHNCMPWAGDGMWYVVYSQNNVGGTSTKTTPFQYADMADLFKIL